MNAKCLLKNTNPKLFIHVLQNHLQINVERDKRKQFFSIDRKRLSVSEKAKLFPGSIQ